MFFPSCFHLLLSKDEKGTPEYHKLFALTRGKFKYLEKFWTGRIAVMRRK